MTLTAEEIFQQAASTGFSAETLEKVFRLLDLLTGIRSHPFLRTRVALKGGTALNLFGSKVPRLSVDIDLNYIASADREGMLADVSKVRQAVQAVCGRENILVKRVPKDHAGGKWRLGFNRAQGGTGVLELDVNFMLRTPLWEPRWRSSLAVGTRQAKDVLVLDDHELATGKLAAMMARCAPRDLFDARILLAREDLDRAKLRAGFVAYGGMSRTDWRSITVDNVTVEIRDVERELVPMLSVDTAPARVDIPAWTTKLISECRDLMGALLPLEENEREFLDRLNDHGEIRPELLSDDDGLRQVIASHPQLEWKALNVRQHRGLEQ